ncbi:type 1 glutamine amidotransferase domain-containing protein [Methylophaga sp. OBS1]|uniref:type 1 glutamine amidotransferase domain-containing protein n=1 Tax=Methylophaga sp. OBS1 TaxID=2991933 RepID=UPI0022500802|nr:type 1 glutamine amidotransferase domain-containing protein [Methylophaga sp. OBS1]MCX4191267.1 type 1 glutamine amidotransferase [Methylophaga sp. OBS1]MCX4191787.1 type 1 glutamine amidotransferase [Methylophaga sp. OBS1]
MKAIILSADHFEDSEVTEPLKQLEQAGVEYDIASLQTGIIKGKKGTEVVAGMTLNEVNTADYALLLLPGGEAPANLRKSERALDIAKHFFAESKLVAAICHGPQILVTADLLKGRKATCVEKIANELIDAGAEYLDAPVVIDENLITSRHPGDLDAFNKAILTKLQPVNS